MRPTTIALAITMLLALPAATWADDISDCNSDKPDVVIQGCSKIIDAGKASSDAMAVTYFNRANAYGDTGDHDSAIADYTQSIKLRPDYVDSYFNRGLTHEDMKDYDGAIADFTQAIKIDPQYAKAYFGRARAYESKGDFKQALAGYEETAKLAPNNATVLKKISDMKQKLGE